MKELIIGTPLEIPARALVRFIRKKSSRKTTKEWELRARRDEININRILQQVLTVDSNCIDIGAHRGSFLRRFVELAPKGHHHAFEPLPQLATYLREEFPTVVVFDCALGDQTGETTFYFVPEMVAWSGLKTQLYPVDTQPKTIEVKIQRLDDIISVDTIVDFIKIDVEGAELEVLKGAKNTITRCKPIILFEYAHIHTAEYGTTPDMVYDFLVEECRLVIYRLDGSGPLAREGFVQICDRSFATNYNRKAETNFLARST